MNTSSESFRYRKLGLLSVLVGNGLLRVAGGASGILAGLYFADLANAGEDVSAVLVGALGAAFYAAELLIAFPMGVLTDRFGPRPVMVVGGILGAGGVALLGLTVMIPVFVVARVFEGIAGGATSPAILTYVADATDGTQQRRGQVMSFFELSVLAGIALGGPVGSRIWELMGVSGFVGIAGIYALSATALAGGGARRRRAPKRVETTDAFRQVFREPHMRQLAPAWLAMNAIVGLWLGPMFTFLLTRREDGNQYLDGLFAGRPELVGWVFLSFSAVFAGGVFAWSFALIRTGAKRALDIGLTAMFGVCACLYLLNHSQLWSESARTVLIVAGAVLVILESGFTPGALALLADLVGRGGGRGAAMGIYSVLLGLGAVIGASTASLFGAWFGVDGLIYGTAIFALVAVLGLRRLAM